ncbi:protein KHNYN-like [Rhinophrynus dorsalis]
MDVGEYGAVQESCSMDEFAVPQGSEKELRDQRPNVERLFGVTLNILGVLTQVPLLHRSAGHQQMWLQLKGERKSIERAKDYIKGLCTPEIMEDLNYPREMHCIFVGAKGLFLDCLIRATSACVKPLTPGRIRISGLAEGAVMAQSQVHAFLEQSTSNTKPEEHEAQIKRNFKDLVENNTDNHALDLLILPTSIKEQLLTLVREDIICSSKVKKPKNQERTFDNTYDISMYNLPFCPGQLKNNSRLDHSISSKQEDRTKSKSSRSILHHRASEPRQLTRDDKWDYNHQAAQPSRLSDIERTIMEVNDGNLNNYQKESLGLDERMLPCRDDNEEFRQISGLLDTIMGRENGQSGSHFSLETQREFNMLLDFFKTMGYQEDVVLKVLSENGIQEPSKILDKVKQEQSNNHQSEIESETLPLNDIPHAPSNKDDDYVLEVVKSAAKNCGYSPSEIVDIGNGSVAGLLRKLNEKNIFEDPLDAQRPIDQESIQLFGDISSHLPMTESNTDHKAETTELLTHKQMFYNYPVEDLFPGVGQQEVGVLEGGAKGTEKEPSASVVTGAQRFNEAMQNPFQLNLKNEKGKEKLRYIVIDGSNVAMIHGLHRFFSCRGIALAVQYFWDRGHREITVFVPQWRMKKDSKVKEQHFLTELNDLGLLSFTPSRTIEGKRITSYDDRFMLHLAEKTDGVIVTNDNLRDIAAESQAWKNIIKDRLLQFTFVGDIFMVPDDPLGRNGPDLNNFLSKSSRPSSKSKGHSFAGRRGPHTPPKPSSQTEVLYLRDRKAGSQRAEQETDIRSHRETEQLRCELLNIFPNQDTKVDFILQREPGLSDLNKLSDLIITLKF